MKVIRKQATLRGSASRFCTKPWTNHEASIHTDIKPGSLFLHNVISKHACYIYSTRGVWRWVWPPFYKEAPFVWCKDEHVAVLKLCVFYISIKFWIKLQQNMKHLWHIYFAGHVAKYLFLKKLVMVRKERQKLNLTQFWGTFLEPSCCPWKVGISKWEKGSSDFSVFTCFQLGKSGYSKQHDKNDIKCCSQSCTDQDQVMSRDQDKICTRVCQGKAESNRGLGL